MVTVNLVSHTLLSFYKAELNATVGDAGNNSSKAPCWKSWPKQCPSTVDTHHSSLLQDGAAYLAGGVAGVPQGIAQVLAGSRGRVHDFHRKARVSLCSGGVRVPVRLGDLLPHNNVEAAAGLVAKHKASVVIISFSIDEEGAAEVHSIKFIKTWKTRPGLG